MFHLQSNNLRVACESLNAMFDIYSEETYDNVLRKLQVVPKLEAGIEILADMCQKQAHHYEEEELEFFEETLYNLEEFIKYKKSNM